VKFLRIEPFAGIAGDMFAAAAVQLTGTADGICALPDALGLENVEIQFSNVKREGIAAYSMTVLEHDRPAEEGTAGHIHRRLDELLAVVEKARLPVAVRIRAADILRRLGAAEASVHGVSPVEVHLHEAGAVDSLIDVCAAALLIDELAVGTVLAEPVCTGFGSVCCAHGDLPVPPPAVAELLKGMPTISGGVEGEMTTPTGAAILAHLGPRFERPTLTVEKTAYGAGSRETPGRPNVLRMSIGKTGPDALATEELVLLESTIDDMSGELLGGHLIGDLLRQGALDAVMRPVVMKKGRSGIQLEVLCSRYMLDALADHLLEHTTTLGVRWTPVERRSLPRQSATVATPFGEISLKIATLPSGRRRAMPEFDDCRAAAEKSGVPILDVYRAALLAAPRE